MSIRNRVVLVTLGFLAVGFVGTVIAGGDKIIIVRDGSVDLAVVNSSLDRRDKERKHKWSKKAEYVQVFEDTRLADVCTTTKVNAMKFDQVELKIKDRTDTGKPPVDLSIFAANEGLLDRLKLRMPGDWRFEFRAFDYRLVHGTGQQFQTRAVKLEQVVITPKAGDRSSQKGAGPTSYPTTPSTETFLCVKFLDDLPED